MSKDQEYGEFHSSDVKPQTIPGLEEIKLSEGKNDAETD